MNLSAFWPSTLSRPLPEIGPDAYTVPPVSVPLMLNRWEPERPVADPAHTTATAPTATTDTANRLIMPPPRLSTHGAATLVTGVAGSKAPAGSFPARSVRVGA